MKYVFNDQPFLLLLLSLRHILLHMYTTAGVVDVRQPRPFRVYLRQHRQPPSVEPPAARRVGHAPLSHTSDMGYTGGPCAVSFFIILCHSNLFVSRTHGLVLLPLFFKAPYSIPARHVCVCARNFPLCSVRYLATVAAYAADSWGLDFQSVEAFNEPIANWYAYADWNGGPRGRCRAPQYTRLIQAKVK